MLAVQEFLVNNSLDELTKQFGIKVKINGEIIGLNYSQINSPKAHPITVECRSLKLIKGTWKIASRAFDRFFNYGEAPEQYVGFVFHHAVIMEKVDGSLVPIWYNPIDERWEISSKSGVFGEYQLNESPKTFRQMVLETFGFTEEEFQEFFAKNARQSFTYIFEYIGPNNKIVTPYENNQMVLLGIRDNFSSGISQYLSLDDMHSFALKMPQNVRMCKIYHLNSFDNILASMKELTNLEEGYVCWDTKHNLRVKIKSPQYVAIHQMRGQFNTTNEGLINVVLTGEIDEVVIYFPDLKEQLEKIQTSIDKFVDTMTDIYALMSDLESQKEFARKALEYKFSNILFIARKNKTSIRHEFDTAQTLYKLKLVKDSDVLKA